VKYAIPTLAVYGNAISPTMYRHPPVLKDGAWYVDAFALAGYIGATVSPDDTGIAITQGGKESHVPSDRIFTDNSVPLVPLDAFVPLGFSATFRDAKNILEVMH
jgi:hypothetical protein